MSSCIVSEWKEQSGHSHLPSRGHRVTLASARAKFCRCWKVQVKVQVLS